MQCYGVHPLTYTLLSLLPDLAKRTGMTQEMLNAGCAEISPHKRLMVLPFEGQAILIRILKAIRSKSKVILIF